MNPYRTTILLGVIFAALGLYLYTIEMPTIQEEIVHQKEDQRLLPFDYRDVTELVFTTRSERIRMVKDAQHRWLIVEPVQAKGDFREVGNILRALEIGKISRVIEEETTTPEEYGLTSPYVTIGITTKNTKETLILGDVGPVSSTLYAQRGSDQQILLTTLSIGDFRRKSLMTFRHKDILFFDRTRADRIQIQAEDQVMTLHRVASIHGTTGNWRFTAPIEGPADKTAVGLLLMTLEDLSATGFIDSASEKEVLLSKLKSPLFTATIHTGRKGHHVSFFQESSQPEEAYVVTSLNDPVYRVPADTVQGLPHSVFQLQDKRLFGMEMADIGLLAVKTRDSEYTLVQQHGDWYVDEHSSALLNQQEVKLFVSRVVDIPAEISISLRQDHLESYDLVSPAIELIGIDTKGRQRGHLAIGKQEKGLVYALGAGLPGVYQARSVILTQIPTLQRLVLHNSKG